jgi:UDP-glucose 4-epimerase
VSRNYLVVGGAGFIGSHFVAELLDRQDGLVRVVDNLCSGTLDHIAAFRSNPLFEFQEFEVEDSYRLAKSMDGINTVIHLASNPDIARAAREPRIDFTQGTVLTESVVEAARTTGVDTILYASGSGVYGDGGNTVLTENSPLRPISTYGASKLAGESLLASYAFMFGLKCLAFRFANVVGPKQTHGVGYDFLRKLKIDESELEILGDGLQTKSYIHVSDVVRAVLLAENEVKQGFEVFNISTQDQISVNEIASIAERILSIDSNSVKHTFTGGDRGWKADVPIVKLSAEKIINLGWSPRFNSEQAVFASLESMANEIKDYL